MKKLLFFILLLSFFGACRHKSGSGNIVTEKRNTGQFTGVIVGAGFEVEIKHGETEVVVEADDNIINDIRTTVVNGKLKIGMQGIRFRDAHLKVFITAPEINDIKSSGAARVVAKDLLRSGAIKMEASSGSEITAPLDAPRISATASSGAKISISGRTRDLNAESSSGSSINALSLLSENTIARASSGASVKVHASVSLDANASSGGRVSYKGGADVKKSISSGGEVDIE